MYRLKSNIKNLIIIFVDCISIIFSLMFANLIRHGSFLYFHGSSTEIKSLMAIFIISYFTIYLVINFNRNYMSKNVLHEAFDIIKMNIAILATSMVIIYFTRIVSEFSRKVFVYFFIINIILMLIYHTILKRLLFYYYKKSSSLRQLLLVTTSNAADAAVYALKQANDISYQISSIAYVDKSAMGSFCQSIPIVADSCTLISYCKTAPLDEVLFILDLEHHSQLENIIKEISSMGIVVHVSIDSFFHDITSHKIMSHFGPFFVITYANRFLSLRQMMIKRAIDLLGGMVGTIILFPMTIVLAPLIYFESPGPIFFKQKRVGKNGRIFTIYKYRSMYMDAETRKEELMVQNEMKGLMFKLKDDPRITRVGKIIRRTSIDELPQFFNILKGDMSLVGTRPPTIDEFEQYQSYHKKRLSITPGLTGMWQVSGRNDITNFEDVVKLDIQYIDNWSLGLDIKILWKTMVVVIRRKGAE